MFVLRSSVCQQEQQRSGAGQVGQRGLWAVVTSGLRGDQLCAELGPHCSLGCVALGAALEAHLVPAVPAHSSVWSAGW